MPYHEPLKFGLSENNTALPFPILDTNKEIVELSFSALLSVIKPSIRGSLAYLTTEEYSLSDG